MTTGADMAGFDVCGPLPTGVIVLEASAGTGKTFTIAALAARYVAEGLVPLENLLVVTFTRMATGELRQRVRERFVSAEAGLTRALAGVSPDPTDDVLVLLATADVEEVTARRDRLRSALSDFDAATIDTTHGFCLRVLSGLGVIGDVERDATFVEDPNDLIDDVVTDFYLRKFTHRGDPAFTLDEARRIARRAVSNTDAALHPGDVDDGSDGHMRRRFAVAVREEVDRRGRRAGILTYDDLLTRLRDTLADEERGATACQRLRDRYRVALVDEFQDTDPVQWEIMRRAFVDASGETSLVLIGDPKQAIYAFRGADVYAYLDAAAIAGDRATLQVNWRSDQALLDGFDALFDGAKLGHEGIVYRPTRAADGHEGAGMTGAPVDAAMRVRILHRGDGLVTLTRQGYLKAAAARACVVADLASDVVRLLSSGAEIPTPPVEAAESDTVPVQPRHVAVLVPRNRDAIAVRDALDEAGVPAVVNGAGSVLATPAARHWLRLLEALERPSAANPVRAVALTLFLGWTAERLATATDAEWETLHARLHRWAAVLRRRGVAALLETVSRREGLARRVLARPQGERELTDIRHIGQLLHAVVTAEQLGVTALTAWLHDAMDGAADEAGAEDSSRRLESDAEAVQVLTVHRSKGLEFPVVYCPFLWHPAWIDADDPPVFHDPAAGDRRTIDVSGDKNSPSHSQNTIEERGEELRLAYVALTRAKHQAVVWWAPTWDSRDSSLCRLLFFRDGAGNVQEKGSQPPSDSAAVARFEDLASRAPGCVSVERVDGGSATGLAPAPTATLDLSAGSFDRVLDPRWRRTSYSGITSGAHESRVASEAEEPVISDEVLPSGDGDGGGPLRAEGAGGSGESAGLLDVPLLLAAMPGGVDVGTFVHGLLEASDFAAADLEAELAAAFTKVAARRLVDVGHTAHVLAGLRAALETPLGPLVGDIRLRDIGRCDRVDELGFELPLVGGDAPTATLDIGQIGQLLSRYLEPGDPLLRYADRLHDPALQSGLRGYLSGSLDLVLRTPDDRYALVDYKTNWLGAVGEELSAWHYRPSAIVDAMYQAHYPLQALLYTVALHRYLRWRLPGYSPERNLAGALYLFVRGMVGPETPKVGGQTCGVFAWKPPVALVESLSDLFDTGTVAA